MKFVRNKETGILEICKDGKKVGEIITMGDELNGRLESGERQQARSVSRP